MMPLCESSFSVPGSQKTLLQYRLVATSSEKIFKNFPDNFLTSTFSVHSPWDISELDVGPPGVSHRFALFPRRPPPPPLLSTSFVLLPGANFFILFYFLILMIILLNIKSSFCLFYSILFRCCGCDIFSVSLRAVTLVENPEVWGHCLLLFCFLLLPELLLFARVPSCFCFALGLSQGRFPSNVWGSLAISSQLGMGKPENLTEVTVFVEGACEPLAFM